MKQCYLVIMWLCLVLFINGCGTSPKKILYLQDMELLGQQTIDNYHQAKIQSGDLLAITVSCMNPELAVPFNLQQRGENEVSQPSLGYQVDANGNIDFPVLGILHVADLTSLQMTEMIKADLKKRDLIKEPTVTMQFLNFKISMLGEVASPGSYQIKGDRITLLEAISMAGDLTITGCRDRVAVIRESKGQRTILYHDLTSADVFKSPYYYLQQNDIVYVEPNRAKAGTSNQSQITKISLGVSIFTTLVTITSLVVSLTN